MLVLKFYFKVLLVACSFTYVKLQAMNKTLTNRTAITITQKTVSSQRHVRHSSTANGKNLLVGVTHEGKYIV